MSDIVAYNDECAGIVKWIQSRTLLNRSGLCLASGIDRSNFDKFMVKGKFPRKHIPKLRTVLQDYGYNFATDRIIDQKKEDKDCIIPEKKNKLSETSVPVAKTTVSPGTPPKPVRLPGEMSLDYKLRVASWEETLKK